MATVHTPSPPATGSSLPGLIFLAYAFFCLGLVVYLSEHRFQPPEPVVAPAPKPKPISVIPDFGAIKDVRKKKAAFFNYLRPAVETQNRQLRSTRQHLQGFQQQLLEDAPLQPEQVQTLNQLAQHYKLEPGPPEELIDNLLVRADELPTAMVLAQAALESAWGTSRFAREANNLFGQWCFRSGCGLVPKRRATDANHEVRKFTSIDEAIAAYFLNINTHPAYRDVRILRVQARLQNQPLTGMVMVAGLEAYSGRGQDYIEELRSIIRVNRLEPVPPQFQQSAQVSPNPSPQLAESASAPAPGPLPEPSPAPQSTVALDAPESSSPSSQRSAPATASSAGR